MAITICVSALTIATFSCNAMQAKEEAEHRRKQKLAESVNFLMRQRREAKVGAFDFERYSALTRLTCSTVTH